MFLSGNAWGLQHVQNVEREKEIAGIYALRSLAHHNRLSMVNETYQCAYGGRVKRVFEQFCQVRTEARVSSLGQSATEVSQA